MATSSDKSKWSAIWRLPIIAMFAFGRFVRNHVVGVIVTAIVLGLLALGYWFFMMHWWDTDARFWQGIYQRFWLDGFFPNGWNVFQATWLTYVIFGILLVIIGSTLYSRKSGRIPTLLVIAGVVTILANATIFPMWLNNMVPAAGLSDGTVVTIEDFGNVPPAIRELTAKAQSVDDTTMRADVRGYTTTITQAPIDLQWAARPASAKGAELVMRSSGESDTNSVLLGDTISYHSNGTWSAIRDGQNYKTIAGVSVWDGVSNKVTTCRFDGANELNYAFNGLWGTNLADLITSRYPDRLIDTRDMWGDCDSEGNPMIVIPTTIHEGYAQIRVSRFGGVIVVKGSPTGEAITELVTDIKAGQFTGPVYPGTLAAEQRQSFDFAAGMLANMNAGFGTEPSSVASQVSNPSEYLLKSKADGKMYWVTPVRPNRGDSQSIIGYTVIAADTAQLGELNANHLYFFGVDDPRIVDLARLYSATVDAVNVAQPSFFSGDSAGSLTEMLPVSDGLWQAFAERGGRVIYRIDISTNAGVIAKVVNIDNSPSKEAPQLACGEPDKLSKAELRQCIDLFLDQLEARK